MKRIILLTLLLLPSVVFAWPWSTDMMNQPSIKPQEGKMFPFPGRSIPIMGIPTTVANREASLNLKNPIPVSEASVKKGRNLSRIYCAACHGLTGKRDTPVADKIGAIDLTDEYVQATLTEGHIWGTITFGSAIMPAYGVPSADPMKGGANDLTVDERWHVVNYVRNGLTSEAK